MSDGIFKQAVFGGFDKQEVLDYLDNLNTEVEKEKKEYSDRVVEVSEEKEKIKEKYFNLQKDYEQLEGHIEEVNSYFEDMQSRNSELRGENLRLNSIIQDYENKQDEFTVNLKNLHDNTKEKEKSLYNKINSLENELRNEREKYSKLMEQKSFFQEKSERYDKLNENIDKIINQAQDKTAFLMEKAYKSTHESADEIKTSFQETIVKFGLFKREIANLEAFMKNLNAKMSSSIDAINTSVDHAINNLDVDGSRLTNEVVKLIEDTVKAEELINNPGLKDEQKATLAKEKTDAKPSDKNKASKIDDKNKASKIDDKNKKAKKPNDNNNAGFSNDKKVKFENKKIDIPKKEKKEEAFKQDKKIINMEKSLASNAEKNAYVKKSRVNPIENDDNGKINKAKPLSHIAKKPPMSFPFEVKPSESASSDAVINLDEAEDKSKKDDDTFFLGSFNFFDNQDNEKDN